MRHYTVQHTLSFGHKKSSILFKNTACDKFPFGLNLSIIWLFDATYGASSFLFSTRYELKTMKVSDLPNAKICNLFQVAKKSCIYFLQRIFQRLHLLIIRQKFYLQCQFHGTKIIHSFEITKFNLTLHKKIILP